MSNKKQNTFDFFQPGNELYVVISRNPDGTIDKYRPANEEEWHIYKDLWPQEKRAAQQGKKIPPRMGVDEIKEGAKTKYCENRKKRLKKLAGEFKQQLLPIKGGGKKKKMAPKKTSETLLAERYKQLQQTRVNVASQLIKVEKEGHGPVTLMEKKEVIRNALKESKTRFAAAVYAVRQIEGMEKTANVVKGLLR